MNTPEQHSNAPGTMTRRPALVTLALVAGLGLGQAGCSWAAESAVVIAPPVDDEAAASAPASETAVLAGGCFWGVQGVFQHVQGVTGAVSGYAGGEASTANYETVGSGRTGHAESVKITFDPKQISYGRILQIYFSVAHNPTELNRQGPDVGTQYRSTIFPSSAEQTRIARSYIAQLDKSKVFGKPIVTTVEPLKGFYPAEAYHQDFLARNPDHPYIAFNDLPKLDNLKRVFPGSYRVKPVLVGPGA
jgi:peptide-methionine (S)-S-oxide reductase